MEVGYHLKYDKTMAGELHLECDDIRSHFNFKLQRSLYQKQARLSATRLNDCFINGRDIDGKLLQHNAYPDVNADVFISHSHPDVESNLFTPLARFLTKHGYSVFVDDWAWDCMDDLINILCPSNASAPKLSREKMMEHIHCMLIKSLASMIDKCPVFLFVDTRNSMPREGQTYSPWIYVELELSALLQPKLEKHAQESFSTKPLWENIVQSPEISHLKRLDALKFKELVKSKRLHCCSVNKML